LQNRTQKLWSAAALASVYFVTGKLGLEPGVRSPSATGVWPPAASALAGLLILGYEAWPAILLAAFLVNITTAARRWCAWASPSATRWKRWPGPGW